MRHPDPAPNPRRTTSDRMTPREGERSKIPCFVFGAASEIDSIPEYVYIAGAERDTQPAGLTETVARAAPYQLAICTVQLGVVGEYPGR
jgi:hypothetical protein